MEKRMYVTNAVDSWRDFVAAKPQPVILDGGLGSELLRRGNNLSTSLWSGHLLATEGGSEEVRR